MTRLSTSASPSRHIAVGIPEADTLRTPSGRLSIASLGRVGQGTTRQGLWPTPEDEGVAPSAGESSSRNPAPSAVTGMAEDCRRAGAAAGFFGRPMILSDVGLIVATDFIMESRPILSDDWRDTSFDAPFII